MPAVLSSMPAMTIGRGPKRGSSLVLPRVAVLPLSTTIGSMATPDLTAEYPSVTCM